MDISIESNLKKFISELDALQKKQIPYALSRTINTLAKEGQRAVVKSIPSTFNNRARWWFKQQPTGIKVKLSSKYNLVSAVFTKVHFATLQEEGGIRKPHAGTNLAIPTKFVPRAERRSNALKNKRGDKSIFKNRAGTAIFKRQGTTGIRKLYSLVPSVHVKARFNFKKKVEQVVDKRFDEVFERELEKALASAF